MAGSLSSCEIEESQMEELFGWNTEDRPSQAHIPEMSTNWFARNLFIKKRNWLTRHVPTIAKRAVIIVDLHQMLHTITFMKPTPLEWEQ